MVNSKRNNNYERGNVVTRSSGRGGFLRSNHRQNSLVSFVSCENNVQKSATSEMNTALNTPKILAVSNGLSSKTFAI